MNKIPDEIIIDIFIKANSLKEVVRLARVNKIFSQILKENKSYICKERLNYHFNISSPEGQECAFLKIAESIPNKTDTDFINQELVNAAEVGDTLKAHVLILMGANVHTNNDMALRHAVNNEHLEIIKLLLEHDANVHFDNDSMLCWASVNGRTETVKLLLDYGANVHANDDEALFYAVGSGYIEIANLLLEHGADIHARNGRILNDLVIDFFNFIRNGDIELIKFSLKYGNIDIHAKNDHALRLAVKKGHFQVVKILLEYGANVHAKNDEALRIAIKNKDIDLVNMLLNHGANINIVQNEMDKFSEKK